MARVVITGISGQLGRILAQRLHLDHEVFGLDRRPFERKPKDIEVFGYDIRRKKCEKIFRNNKIDIIYHLNIMHDFHRSLQDLHSFNVIGTQRVLEYAARYGVRKVVLLSTANLYGARPDNPQFLDENSPLMAGERFSELGSLISVDMLTTTFFWKHPEIETVILRPSHILGSVRNAPSMYLTSTSVVPTVLGFDPMLQPVHEKDVVEALALAGKEGIRGVFNIGGPGVLPLSRLLALLGRKRLPLPFPVLKAALNTGWGIGLFPLMAPEIEFLRYPCLVDDRLARQVLKYKPAHSLTETIEALKNEDLYSERFVRGSNKI